MFFFQQSTTSFEVREILHYQPSGLGLHVFGQFRKAGISTRQLKRAVSERGGIPLRLIRHAGQKDAAATATQWLSWPRESQRAPITNGDYGQLVRLTAHTNAIALGHVRSNRFGIILDHDDRVSSGNFPVLPHRFPNYFGPQRFGSLLKASFETVLAAINRAANRMDALSVLQAWLFNRYLKTRLEHTAKQAFEDDFWMHPGAKRWFQNPLDAEIAARYEAGSISPSGPLFGYKVNLTAGEVAFLAEFNLKPADFRQWGKAARGTRRPLFCPLNWYGHHSWAQGKLRLDFGLPTGSYATVWLTHAFLPNRLREPMANWPNFVKGCSLEEEVQP